MTFNQILLVNLGAFIAAVGGIFLKRFSLSLVGHSLDWQAIPPLLLNINLLLGGVCYVVPIIFWAYLLKEMELTKLQPLLSIVYIYTAALAYLFLGEQPSTQRILGIVIVIIGVAMVGGT